LPLRNICDFPSQFLFVKRNRGMSAQAARLFGPSSFFLSRKQASDVRCYDVSVVQPKSKYRKVEQKSVDCSTKELALAFEQKQQSATPTRVILAISVQG
jgi:hypothetical protein